MFREIETVGCVGFSVSCDSETNGIESLPPALSGLIHFWFLSHCTAHMSGRSFSISFDAHGHETRLRRHSMAFRDVRAPIPKLHRSYSRAVFVFPQGRWALTNPIYSPFRGVPSQTIFLDYASLTPCSTQYIMMKIDEIWKKVSKNCLAAAPLGTCGWSRKTYIFAGEPALPLIPSGFRSLT
jgi:hypothetical protein